MATVKKSNKTFSKEELANIEQYTQRQDSLEEQMKDLLAVANRLGLYDAADWIKKQFDKDE